VLAKAVDGGRIFGGRHDHRTTAAQRQTGLLDLQLGTMTVTSIVNVPWLMTEPKVSRRAYTTTCHIG
jgi:hypothetical protein